MPSNEAPVYQTNSFYYCRNSNNKTRSLESVAVGTMMHSSSKTNNDPLASSLLLDSSTNPTLPPRPLVHAADAPYIRLRLHTQTSRAVPEALQPLVSRDDWNAFWSHLEPILTDVERYTRVLCLAGYALVAAYVAFFILMVWGFDYFGVDSYMIQYATILHFVTIFVVVYAAVMGFNAWNGHVRKLQFQALRSACQEEEDRLFRQYGYTVACEYEWDTSTGSIHSGFYVYFFHAQYKFQDSTLSHQTTFEYPEDGATKGGYLHIRLFDSGNSGFSCTPISMPYLESFRTMPVELETRRTTDLWERFWSEMLPQSSDHLFVYRLHHVSLYLWLTFMMLSGALFNASWYSERVDSIVFLLVMLPLFYSSCRLLSLVNKQRDLVTQYAREFATHGIFIEYRRVYRFPDWRGMSGVHYLCLFPLPERETHSGTV
jgi:hypothetical protein